MCKSVTRASKHGWIKRIFFKTAELILIVL